MRKQSNRLLKRSRRLMAPLKRNKLLLAALMAAASLLIAGIITKTELDIRSRASIQPTLALTKPIVINSTSYQKYGGSFANFPPMIARGLVLGEDAYSNELTRLTDLRKTYPNLEFRLGFGSVQLLKSKLEAGEGSRLKALGVTTLSYNPEGDPSHTPPEEFALRYSATSNPIVQFVQLAKRYGFKTTWAPLRADADNTKDDVLTQIYGAGLDGLALQEQQFIENQCVKDRVAKVNTTLARHSAIAKRAIEKSVQIMSSRCLTGDTYMAGCNEGTKDYLFEHCDMFVDQIAGSIDTMAIWSNGDDTPLITTLRAGSPVVPSPLPTPSLRPSVSPTSSPSVKPTSAPTRTPKPSAPPSGGDAISPHVSIVQPSEGDEVNRNKTFLTVATATDNVLIDKVQFGFAGRIQCIDPEAPYRCNIEAPNKRGRYGLSVKAFDAAGNASTETIVITVR